LVQRSEKNVSHSKELAGLDGTAGETSSKAVPIAVIDRCGGSVAIEDRIRADRKVEGEL
jgi:hypothetical protein